MNYNVIQKFDLKGVTGFSKTDVKNNYFSFPGQPIASKVVIVAPSSLVKVQFLSFFSY